MIRVLWLVLMVGPPGPASPADGPASDEADRRVLREVGMTARSLPDFERKYALLPLGRAYFALGDREEARARWREAFDAIDRFMAGNSYGVVEYLEVNEWLLGLGAEEAGREAFGRAEALAGKVGADERFGTYATLALMKADLGDAERARKLLREGASGRRPASGGGFLGRIGEDARRMAEATEAVEFRELRRLLKAGDRGAVAPLLQRLRDRGVKLPDPSAHGEFLARLVKVQIETGDPSGAMETARLLRDWSILLDKKAAIRLEVAESYRRKGNRKAALEMTREALPFAIRSAKGTARAEPPRPDTLKAAARLLAELGEHDAAKEAASALDLATDRVPLLAEIASKVARDGHRDRALALLREAEAQARDFDETPGGPRFGPQLHLALARTRLGLGGIDGDVVRFSPRLWNEVVGREAASRAVSARVASGHLESAAWLAGTIPDWRLRSLADAEVAAAMARSGYPEKALRWAMQRTHPLERSRALGGVASGIASRAKPPASR